MPKQRRGRYQYLLMAKTWEVAEEFNNCFTYSPNLPQHSSCPGKWKESLTYLYRGDHDPPQLDSDTKFYHQDDNVENEGQGGKILNDSSCQFDGERHINTLNTSEVFSVNIMPTVLQRSHSDKFPAHETSSSFSEGETVSTTENNLNTGTTCAICHKQFSCLSKLTSHLRSHTGEKPFPCSQCEKKFSHKGNLKQHLLLHAGIKPFSCVVCNKAFASKDQLLSHRWRIHSGDYRPFRCNECDARFKRKDTFDAHKCTHDGQKPYMCNICLKGFTRRGNLKTHIRTHTGEKPFSCSLCKKTFTCAGDCKKHTDLCFMA